MLLKSSLEYLDCSLANQVLFGMLTIIIPTQLQCCVCFVYATLNVMLMATIIECINVVLLRPNVIFFECHSIHTSCQQFPSIQKIL